MTTYAKIIDDSISEAGIRITTLELEYPRFIHSEFMTHRMFSRNASSSRAIPIEKMLKQVEENPAMPIHWGKNQPGMQAREEVEFPDIADEIWRYGANRAVDVAIHLKDCELHKQIVNRVLEPFQHIKVVVTATEWDNFFKLRLHPDAQPEMYELARVMKEAMDNSKPVKLKRGEWHLPYVSSKKQEYGLWIGLDTDCPVFDWNKAIKCSVARCARVSYLNHDKSEPNVDKDIVLADKLLEFGHMSPFEHQATPMYASGLRHKLSFGSPWEKGVTHMDRHANYWSGNFRGFLMYRQLLEQGAI